MSHFSPMGGLPRPENGLHEYVKELYATIPIRLSAYFGSCLTCVRHYIPGLARYNEREAVSKKTYPHCKQRPDGVNAGGFFYFFVG